jgi:hypothetical protein
MEEEEDNNFIGGLGCPGGLTNLVGERDWRRVGRTSSRPTSHTMRGEREISGLRTHTRTHSLTPSLSNCLRACLAADVRCVCTVACLWGVVCVPSNQSLKKTVVPPFNTHKINWPPKCHPFQHREASYLSLWKFTHLIRLSKIPNLLIWRFLFPPSLSTLSLLA